MTSPDDEVPLALSVARSDEARIDALLLRLPVASRPSLLRHALRIGLAALERDPLHAPSGDAPAAAIDPPIAVDEPLRAAVLAYAKARHAAKGRALPIARARELLDHAVDELLATSRWRG